MRIALLISVLFLGCAPSLKMRRLERPTAALGDVHSLSLEVVGDPKLDTFSDKSRISDYFKARVLSEFKSSRLTICEPAPCGDGLLRLSLSNINLNAPATANPFGALFGAPGPNQHVVSLVIAHSFTPTRGETRSNRLTSTGSQDAPAEAILRDRLNDFAHDYVAALAPRAPLTELTLEACEGCNPGIELLHRADWAGAEKVFRAVVDKRAEDSAAWFDLGVALEAQGLWASALEAFTKAGDSRSVSEISKMLR